jgi:hypothetical protein
MPCMLISLALALSGAAASCYVSGLIACLPALPIRLSDFVLAPCAVWAHPAALCSR